MSSPRHSLIRPSPFRAQLNPQDSIQAQIYMTSASAIARWNQRLSEPHQSVSMAILCHTTLWLNLPQRRVSRLVKAVIYPVGSYKARAVLLPVHVEPGAHPDESVWAEDVNVARWFPHGARYIRITTVPATNFPLVNDYTLVTSAIPLYAPANRSISQTLGVELKGNVVVLRHSAPRPMRITNIHPAERRLIDLVIYRCAYDSGLDRTPADSRTGSTGSDSIRPLHPAWCTKRTRSPLPDAPLRTEPAMLGHQRRLRGRSLCGRTCGHPSFPVPAVLGHQPEP